MEKREKGEVENDVSNEVRVLFNEVVVRLMRVIRS